MSGTKRSRRAWAPVLALAALYAAPAHAAAAVDSAGADRIRQAIARYVGDAVFAKGTVAVETAGDAYVVKVDLNALLAGIEGLKYQASTPLIYRLKPRDDGRFDASFNEEFSYTFVMPGQMGPETWTGKAEACTSSGIYDPAILGFPEATVACGRYLLTAKGPESEMEAVVHDLKSVMTASGAGDNMDFGLTQTHGAFEETIRAGANPSLTVKIAAREGEASATVQGYRNVALTEFLGALMRHGDLAALQANQAGLKTQVTGTLPLWSNAKVDATIRDVTVDTQAGTARLASMRFGFDLTGLGKEAGAAMTLGYTGLELPSSLPSWIRELPPKEGSLTFGADHVDADGLARLAIDRFDASRSPPIPASAEDEFLRILSQGKPRFFVRPSSFGSNIAELRLEGDMTLLPPLSGKFTVAAKGVDELLVVLNKSDLPDAEKTQAGMALSLVKGMGKTDADGRLLWEIDFDVTAGRYVVNGLPLPFGK